MKIAFVLLLSLLAFSMAEDKSDHWAVLVAGSDGYWNYRHQSDICHAFQIMKSHGIPEDQIIVFAKDDIAGNSQNPFPGKIFNKPDGDDVYAGCTIDYSGSDVTPKKFLEVLEGKGDGKVLKSNSKSKVFINFSDHGAPGLIAFPSEYLYAKDFHTTLKAMNSAQMYNEMTIYIEACESGSMFENILEDDLNIYATTAANSVESSWAYYCSPNDMVDGKHIGSCLGDEYSITWMEDSDANDICSETLDTQFTNVQTAVKESHVMEFGTMKFKTEPVGNFQGTCDATSRIESLLKSSKVATEDREFSRVDSRDVKMHYLYTRYMESGSQEDADALTQEMETRSSIEQRHKQIRARANIEFEAHPSVGNFDCYKELVETYRNGQKMDEYELEFLGDFVNLCNSNLPRDTLLNIVA